MLKTDNYMAKKLLLHRGHSIECVSYGDWNDPADVCIECTDCGEVLVSAEDFISSASSEAVPRNELPEFIGQIIDIFEDFLEEKGINIENDEKNDRDDPESAAIIYGTDYGQLQSDIESTLIGWGIVKEEEI